MSENLRLIQLGHSAYGRKVALVQEPNLVLLQPFSSVYALAQHAIQKNIDIREIIHQAISDELLAYEGVYENKSDWHLLPAFDNPDNPFACLVSGTGLTHRKSAMNRQVMHQEEQTSLTDSMKMYQWGIEGGRPAPGVVGAQPEWFYKGQGHILRAHGQPLEIPAYGNGGGDEPEIAGVYMVDTQGNPRRIGFCPANEFSDHIMEKKNYLYLAPSKLRNCAIGPELVIGAAFQKIKGKVSAYRSGQIIWSKEIHTGEQAMAHSLANLEYHHFKYESHRVPWQAHVHFMGADAFSYGEQIKLMDNDLMEVYWEGMGRPLRNTLKVSQETEKMITVKPV